MRPDPPRVEEVLEVAAQQLQINPTRQERADNRNAVRRAQEAAEAARAAADIMPESAADRALREQHEAEAAALAARNRINFDEEDKNDGDKATDNARHIKVEFDAGDIRFWFAQLEDEMLLGNINSQWLKKSVLQRNLPIKQKEDVKELLTLPKAEAGANIYLRVKNDLLRIYAPKPHDAYRKALTRTMVGLPSQLGNQIINDICKKAVKLGGCCCSAAAFALWSIQLPVNIRAHISNSPFTKDTYKNVFQEADQVYLSSAQVNVAALAALDETLPAFSEQNQPQQVAAFGKPARGGSGRGGGRGQRGQRGGGGRGGRGGKPQGQSRGPRHSSNPPESCCDRHYRHGDGAWFCLAPSTCPWANKVTPKST